MSHSGSKLKIWIIAISLSTASVGVSFWLIPLLVSKPIPSMISARPSEKNDHRADDVSPINTEASSNESVRLSEEGSNAIGHIESGTNERAEESVPSDDPSLEPATEGDVIACEAGLNQSPINLERPLATRELRPLVFEYAKTQSIRLNQIGRQRRLIFEQQKPGSLSYLGRKFSLDSISAKFPAEHLIEGEAFSAELQFLHRDDSKRQMLILAVMVQSGSTSIWPQKFLTAFRDGDEFKISDLIPKDHTYYQYNGSLTESPCNEGVTWIVLKKPLFASEEDLLALKEQIGMEPRPLQASNGRSLRVSLR
jgi:carbonic anhydrase